ncbi:MAG TPA: nuclear transport factor 2 family protein [Gammaproteobacteria bacterium]|nr:nuclear transport factor 2 family protein [Gammaproteobacteria bacterium]
MKATVNPLGRALLGALSAACLALTMSSGVRAQEVTAETLVDRLQIQDLITRYYNNFGRENAENFADFYAEDAELILGERHYKGRDGIMQAYGRAPRAPDQPPRSTPPPRFSFIVAVDNPLIVVHGTTATAQLVYTEYVIEKQGDQVKVITQGKEYSTFVKAAGHWRYKTRLIKSGTELPEGWKE